MRRTTQEAPIPRPLRDSPFIYGLHDPGGHQLMLDRGVPGWVLITVAIGADPNDGGPGDDGRFHGDYRPLSDAGLGVIVRLNNGYSPGGTLPPAARYPDFARRCAAFVRNSQGCHIWIAGNEPNHPVEWPGADWDWNAQPPRPKSEASRGEPITPERYAACYASVRAAIHALPGRADDQVLVAGPAPWNNLLTYPGNPSGDWVQYLADVLARLRPEECDGVSLHTYTHGPAPALITSEAKMDPPFAVRRFHFRAYQDFMAAVAAAFPARLTGLPVYITETDQGDGPWQNENTGWVRAAYAEIDRWNAAHDPKVRALMLYRWPQVPGDRWGIDGKAGVVDDLAAALAPAYRWERAAPPDAGLATQVEQIESAAAALAPAITATAGLAADLSALAARLADLRGQAGAVPWETLSMRLNDLQTQAAALEKDLGPAAAGAVAQPPLQDVRGGLPQHATLRYPTRPVSAIRRVIVHHTVTGSQVAPQVIATAQVGQGRAGISYHFVVEGDGTIYWTQPLETATEQALLPAVNADGVGVALVGNFMAAPPPAPQLAAAAALIAWLLDSLGLAPAEVYGRNEVEEKKVDSPGAQWLTGARYRAALLAQVNTLLGPAAPGDDPGEVERLRQQVSALQAQIEDLGQQAAGLQEKAALVDPLQKQAQALQATVASQAQEISRLQALLRDAGAAQGGARKPTVRDVVDSLPHHPTLRYAARTQPISTIVIHHTDSPKTATPESIANYHVYGVSKDAQGNLIKGEWPGIGYHYVIAADGAIFQTQRHETCSYHVGAPNNYCLGVSLIGCFSAVRYDGKPQAPADQLPTPEQMRSTAQLVAWLLSELKLSSVERVLGHKEVGQTSCPGDQWTAGANWKAQLYDQIRSLQAGGVNAAAGDALEHYLLFWDHGHDWAAADWRNAAGYIAHFRPTSGFSAHDAALARHVTIVGGEAGVSGADEAQLRAAGVDVHRLAGADEASTRALLDALVAANTPWPGAAATPTRGPAAPGPLAAPAEDGSAPALPLFDEWTVPDDWQPPLAAAAPPAARAAGPLRIKVLPYE